MPNGLTSLLSLSYFPTFCDSNHGGFTPHDSEYENNFPLIASFFRMCFPLRTVNAGSKVWPSSVPFALFERTNIYGIFVVCVFLAT